MTSVAAMSGELKRPFGAGLVVVFQVQEQSRLNGA
jgi:hypothetical protein